ncbi:MAG: amino acid ABC transporter permease [Holophaga sp.]|nr:amino acid ABC transporter permease [Holophaga sp.]
MGNLFDFQFFLSTFPELAGVIPVTLKITLVAMLASLAVGLAVALVRINRVPGLSQLAAVYLSFARGTPMLVQIYLSYYGIPLVLQFLHERYGWTVDVSQIPAIVFIYFAFTFNVAAYLSETIRAAILAIDKGQMEAALSVGMSPMQGMRRIVLPQALAVALPSLGNTVIALVKDTSLAFMISVVEMMGEAKILGARGLRFFEVYVAVALVYWAICIVIERLVAIGEKRVRRFEGLAEVRPS